jgi:hypothetical protein
MSKPIREGIRQRPWEEVFLLEVCTRLSLRMLQTLSAELADEPSPQHDQLRRLVLKAMEWHTEGVRAKGVPHA